jgi:flagellar basal-body rod modification protein FlgD
MSTSPISQNVTSLFGAQATSPSATKDRGVGSDKEAFLKLLVAQTSQQDPMAPQDSNQYVQQLTQFSSLEQLMSLNEGIQTLAVGQMSNNSQQSVDIIDKTVVAKGDHFNHSAGQSEELSFEVAGKADKVTITIADQAGNTVKEVQVEPAEGLQSYRWNGRDDDGKSVPTGVYTISVQATNEDAVVPTSTYVKGKVTGVRFDQGYPEIMIGDRRISMNDVIEVN